jgi:hypothetical protein
LNERCYKLSKILHQAIAIQYEKDDTDTTHEVKRSSFRWSFSKKAKIDKFQEPVWMKAKISTNRHASLDKSLLRVPIRLLEYVWPQFTMVTFPHFYSRSDFFAATVYRTPFGGLATRDALHLYVRLAESLNDDSFLKCSSIRAGIDLAWDRYGSTSHYNTTLIYVLYLMCTSVCNYKYMDLMNQGNSQGLSNGLLLVSITIIFTCYFFLVELGRFFHDVSTITK